VKFCFSVCLFLFLPLTSAWQFACLSAALGSDAEIQKPESPNQRTYPDGIDDIWTCNIQSMIYLFLSIRLWHISPSSSSGFHLSEPASHLRLIVPCRLFAQTASLALLAILSLGFFYFIQSRPCNRSTSLDAPLIFNGWRPDEKPISVHIYTLHGLKGYYIFFDWLCRVHKRQLVVWMFESGVF